MKISYSASSDVRAAIDRIGRTEDVQFSPDGSRLAVAGFTENRILVLGIEADWDTDDPKVAFTKSLEFNSDELRNPHGLSWLDDRTLAIANRSGHLTIFELPEEPASGRTQLSPVRTLGDHATDLLKTPGSVSAVPVGLDLFELIVCNNYVHHISRHLVDRRDDYALIASDVLTHDGLAVPDGVTHSPSGRWIAVSNHGHHNVLIFRNDADLSPASRPVAVLNGIQYPHGVRFSEDGRTILVADAGAPFVHVYRAWKEWTGDLQPDVSVRVLSEESYLRGRTDPSQGGPKGVDITADQRLMVISCEEERFAFFDVRDLLAQSEPAESTIASEAESAREAFLRYLAFDSRRVEEATAAIQRATDLQILAMVESRSWKITAPLRSAKAAIRRTAPHLWSKY
jgi:DNA-binding beta-propeller fold protein YncE